MLSVRRDLQSLLSSPTPVPTPMGCLNPSYCVPGKGPSRFRCNQFSLRYLPLHCPPHPHSNQESVTKRHGQQKLCPLWTVTLASGFFSSLVSFGEWVPTWFQYLFFFSPSGSLFQSTGENEAPWRGPGLGGQSLWHPWCSTSCLSQRPNPIPIFIWCLSKYLKAALTAPKGLASHPD